MRTHIWQIRWQISPQNGNLQFVLINSYSENSYVADQVLNRFLLWELISGRSAGRSPPKNGNLQLVLIDSYSQNSYLADQVLIDSYSENSYLADQVADLPSQKWQFSASSDRILLWEHISGRSGGRATPLKWQFAIGTYRFILSELIFGRSGGRYTPHKW